MANTYVFRGDAVAVAQITTIVVGGTWVAADTVTLTVNGKDIVITIGATVTVAAIALAIQEAWSGADISGDNTRSGVGSAIVEFTEATATEDAVDTVTLTATVAGVPFIVSIAKVSTSGTVTLATPTVSNGPNHWTKENFFKDDVPSDDLPGDAADASIFIETNTVSILYDLDQSAGANVITALNITSGYTGQIGLPQVNSSGYAEYRERYLMLPDQTGDTAVDIGFGSGSGSSRIHLDFGASQTTVSIANSSTSPITDRKAIVLKGTNASNTLSATGGQIDIAPDSDDTSIFLTVEAIGTADVRASSGTDISTLLQVEDDAVVVISPLVGNALAAVLMTGSPTVTIGGDAPIATIDLLGGTLDYQASGTVTTLNGGPDATIDFAGNPNTPTFTSVNVEARFTLNDPDAKVVFTNPIGQGNLSENDWSHNFGKGRTLHPEG